jgi:hypothetical protein
MMAVARPESYKIDCDSIQVGEIIPATQDEPVRLYPITYRYLNDEHFWGKDQSYSE